MRAHGYEANAVQRALPNDTPSSRAGFSREFDEPIALPLCRTRARSIT